MIVGLTGQAQHGKDTVGARLVTRWDFVRFAFADALRSMALTLNPWVDVSRQSGRLVESKVYHRLADLVTVQGWDDAKLNPEVRRVLQVLGTEGVRDHVGEDSWIRALERRWMESGAQDAVITDVRFANEAEWIKRHGGYVIRVVRPNFDNGTPSHSSEVVDFDVDRSIVNDGGLGDLDAEVDRIAADVIEGFPLAAVYR